MFHAPQTLADPADQPAGALRTHGSSARWLRILAHVRLSRPEDNLFAFLGTLLGAGLAGASVPASTVVIVAASNALLSAGSMMVNDWHDVGEDAINRPDRPVPSGAVPRRRALALGLAAFAVGCALAALAGGRFGVAAVAVTLLSVLYTTRFKATPVLGNGVTGLLSAYPLWCWYALEGFDGRVYLGAAIGFLVAGTGREIVRTAGDTAGDAALGIRTVATLWGGPAAIGWGFALILGGCVVAWYSAIGSHWLWYQTALSLAVLVLAAGGGYGLLIDSPSRASGRLTIMARAMTVLLALGVVADLIAGGWGGR